MRLRRLFVSLGCCAAALGLSLGKAARAGELDAGGEPVQQTAGQCANEPLPVSGARGCERIGGNLRIDFGPRAQSPSGYGPPGASPAAVRDTNTGPRGYIRLPVGALGFDPVRR
ncbi:MAG TPA: hypothetical protein VFF88_05240 [Methylocella sp.]|nr:hypothetical protein [Methylocella sp.]